MIVRWNQGKRFLLWYITVAGRPVFSLKQPTFLTENKYKANCRSRHQVLIKKQFILSERKETHGPCYLKRSWAGGYPELLSRTMGLPTYIILIICSSWVQLLKDQAYTRFGSGKEEEFQAGLPAFIWAQLRQFMPECRMTQSHSSRCHTGGDQVCIPYFSSCCLFTDTERAVWVPMNHSNTDITEGKRIDTLQLLHLHVFYRKTWVKGWMLRELGHLSCEDRLSELGLLSLEKALARP